MAHPRLRIYGGPQQRSNDGTASQSEDQQKEAVQVSLGEVLPLLAEAFRSERTWLKDFADDEIAISMDLYEVILAYQHYRNISA